MYTRIHAYAYTCTHTILLQYRLIHTYNCNLWACTRIHAYAYTCTHTILLHIHTIATFGLAHKYIYIYVHVHTYIHKLPERYTAPCEFHPVYIHVYIHVCIHKIYHLDRACKTITKNVNQN